MRSGCPTGARSAFPMDSPTAPLISVVIPVRDDAEALRRCLRALAAQRRPADEVLVVDNASTDDSAAVALAAGARVIWCAERGIGAASAAGYDAALGDLILRLDADCVPGRSWIDSVARAFAAYPEADVVTGPARFGDGPRLLRRPLAAAYLGSYFGAAAMSLGHLPVFGSNFAMRAGAWSSVSADVHRTDPEVHDDFDLAFHLGEHHAIHYLRHLDMEMSMRPFRSIRSLRRRFRRGLHTVAIHWPEHAPPRRWARRQRVRRADRLA